MQIPYHGRAAQALRSLASQRQFNHCCEIMAEHTEEAIKWGWMMFFWGILLIAIGASMVSRVMFGSKHKGGWSSWSCGVGPSFKERDQDEGQFQTTD